MTPAEREAVTRVAAALTEHAADLGHLDLGVGEADEESAAREAVVEAALASEIDLGHYDARTRLRLESAVRKLRVVLAKKGAV